MRVRLACVVLALSSWACLVDIRHDVDDPSAAFRKAREAAARVQGEKGPPHHLNVLVYDAGDRELVSVSAPLWLARKLGGMALHDEHDADEGIELARRCLDPANLEKAVSAVSSQTW
jgi:hypothetical protein